MKLLWIVVLAAVAWRMIAGRWPWQTLGISQWPEKPKARTSFAVAEARVLLGLDETAGRKEILEAHRRQLASVHPDRGGSNEQVHAVNAAKDLLLASLDEQGKHG